MRDCRPEGAGRSALGFDVDSAAVPGGPGRPRALNPNADFGHAGVQLNVPNVLTLPRASG